MKRACHDRVRKRAIKIGPSIKIPIIIWILFNVHQKIKLNTGVLRWVFYNSLNYNIHFPTPIFRNHLLADRVLILEVLFSNSLCQLLDELTCKPRLLTLMAKKASSLLDGTGCKFVVSTMMSSNKL